MSAARQRGVARVSDAAGFAGMVGIALDHVAPVASVQAMPRSPVQRTARMVGVFIGRLVVIALAAALVFGIAWAGWQLLSGPAKRTAQATNSATDGLLTSAARPAVSGRDAQASTCSA